MFILGCVCFSQTRKRSVSRRTAGKRARGESEPAPGSQAAICVFRFSTRNYGCVSSVRFGNDREFQRTRAEVAWLSRTRSIVTLSAQTPVSTTLKQGRIAQSIPVVETLCTELWRHDAQLVVREIQRGLRTHAARFDTEYHLKENPQTRAHKAASRARANRRLFSRATQNITRRNPPTRGNSRAPERRGGRPGARRGCSIPVLFLCVSTKTGVFS